MTEEYAASRYEDACALLPGRSFNWAENCPKREMGPDVAWGKNER